MNEKLVSVLIPVYNVEKYVEEAIKSIQNQTYKNLEIIIVDDGSTDSTYYIVQELAAEDPRIKLFKNETNSKIVKTLNKAFKNSSGDYIARMDGDDISELDRIEKKVAFLEANSEYDLVGCSVNSINEKGELLGSTSKLKCYDRLDKLKKYSTPVYHIWVAKREVYESLGGYRELSGVEDYDFLLRMNTSGFKYTNLELYYGYNIRIERAGNTKDLMGLRQIKLHRYAYKLYVQRRYRGVDDFPKGLSQSLETGVLSNKLYNLSLMFLIKAIERKKEKKIFSMSFFLLASLISPYQIYYIKNKLVYRFLMLLIAINIFPNR